MHRREKRLEEPPEGILFPGFDRKEADKDLPHCLLYLANYFFYKFGLEVGDAVLRCIGYRPLGVSGGVCCDRRNPQ